VTPPAPLSPVAIDATYRAHGASVLRRAWRLLGSEDEAREVLQEVFMSLLEGPGQVREAQKDGGITAWLYGATTNACLNRLRNARTRARLLAARGAALEEGAAGQAEDITILRDVLARVPAELASVAVYYYADEMTHEEIADVLDCSRRHVGDLLAKLRESVHAVTESSAREVES
jgi:RNA polymerase sigma factor (sigma-70 family)